MLEGTGDFDLDDLDLIRGRLPDRHVTLDGDAITVWSTQFSILLGPGRHQPGDRGTRTAPSAARTRTRR
ncbi:hypothetical protein [Streptomyces sp. NPDC055692]|uniref:hypothetical protein n=1 Tax=Streptomyces sp. NPDC055692 TaxID=3155683 RepID=UPI0034417974